MQDWQKSFIDYSITKNVLQFGHFTLKSGRNSPYFFNAGKFDDGLSQKKLGEIYAKTLIEAGIEFDMVFGPAYKGIPLATSTVYALSDLYDRNVPFAFNRKEAKDHGEGGSIVGAPLQGKVVLVDDVITAGTAIKETLALLESYPEAELAAAVVLIDRQEKLDGSELSAIQALEKTYGIQILAAVKLEQIMAYIDGSDSFAEHLAKMNEYREQYGVF
ncbi:orotate phosphoribosyltransferase [Reinekea marinisedimentorum]|uniref:orotate phosphoribosyltransferase n=1 Tax=Reinekea marinisedimentorum TaxID=230495 RepID=UPI00140552EC|nr:orotate phosphoribosyltransferase [Reinekea marinisedimentorum]